MNNVGKSTLSFDPLPNDKNEDIIQLKAFADIK